jgi:hypothetical protein
VVQPDRAHSLHAPELRRPHEPRCDLDEKATTTAALEHPARTNAGYFQDGEFVRWREISAQYNLTESMARIFPRPQRQHRGVHAQREAVDRLSRVDPEVDFTGSG